MVIGFKAALCAAALLCASEAQAARILTLTFDAVGSGEQQLSGRNDSVLIVQPISEVRLSVVVEEGFFEGSNYYRSLAGSAEQITSFSFSPSGLAISTSGQTPQFTSFSGSGSVCFDGTTVAAPGPGAVNPACSNISYTSTGTVGVRPQNFSGRVVNFTIAEGNTLGGATLAVAVIPEPSTWALMLAGFSLTGYALRRRRTRVAFA